MAASCRQVVVAAAVVVVLLTCGANIAAACPAPADHLVYPYAALCGFEGAAVYYGKEVYELGVASLIGTIAGRLAPEWDETNSTFYVRSADVGAKYAFFHQRTRELRGVVAQSDDVMIVNSETGRHLSWRKEGGGEADDDQWFLVEVDADADADDFQFSRAPFASMSRCNFVDPRVTCYAYHILNFGSTSLGLTPYWENGVTYFMLSNVSNSSTFPPSGFETNSFQLLRNGVSLEIAAAAA